MKKDKKYKLTGSVISVIILYTTFSITWVSVPINAHSISGHMAFALISWVFFIGVIIYILAKYKKMDEHTQDNTQLVIKEMNHRIKNNIGILTNIIDLKKFVYRDETSQKLLDELRDKTFLISHIHEKIYTSVDESEISLKDYVEEIINSTNEFYGDQITIIFDIDNFVMIPKHAINVALVIQEIFTNSVKYAYVGIKDKRFYVTLKGDIKHLEFTIADNGVGFDINKLGSSESFGMEMIKTIVKQYNGSISFTNHNGMIVKIILEK